MGMRLIKEYENVSSISQSIRDTNYDYVSVDSGATVYACKDDMMDELVENEIFTEGATILIESEAEVSSGELCTEEDKVDLEAGDEIILPQNTYLSEGKIWYEDGTEKMTFDSSPTGVISVGGMSSAFSLTDEANKISLLANGSTGVKIKNNFAVTKTLLYSVKY